jgi:cytochrome c-type biogenesis protein CcmH/NrfG
MTPLGVLVLCAWSHVQAVVPTEADLGAEAEAIIAKYEPIVAAEPRDVASLYVLGMAYFKKGWNAKAMQAFEQVISLSPRDDNGFYALGLCLRRAKEYERARGARTPAVRLSRGGSYARSARGQP